MLYWSVRVVTRILAMLRSPAQPQMQAKEEPEPGTLKSQMNAKEELGADIQRQPLPAGAIVAVI